MFSNISPATISSKFHENHGNFEETVECLISLNDSSSSDNNSDNNHNNNYNYNRGNYNNNDENDEKSNRFKAAKNKRNHQQRPYTSRTSNNVNNDVIDDYDCDPDHCRKLALKYQKLRNEAFGKASKAYGRRSRNRGIELTHQYSEMGQYYDQEMKKWNLKRAMLLVEQRKKTGENILDLHGLTVEQALDVVEKQLHKGSTYNGKPLEIITGVGNHSLNGIPKLPNAVKQFLKKNDWNFIEKRGYLIVEDKRKKNI